MLDDAQNELSEEMLLVDLGIFISIQLLFSDIRLMKYHTAAEYRVFVLKSHRFVHGFHDVFFEGLEIEFHQAEVGDLFGKVVSHYEEVKQIAILEPKLRVLKLVLVVPSAELRSVDALKLVRAAR